MTKTLWRWITNKFQYDPVSYWRGRYTRQGPCYVAKNGSEEVWDEQLKHVSALIDTLPLEPGTKVLDYGCGPGRFREAVENHGATWDGYDLIPGLGTVDRLEPDSYDIVLAIYVLQHIVDDEAYRNTLFDIKATLRPGGVLFVVDHLPMWLRAPHMNPRGPQGIRETYAFNTGVSVKMFTGDKDHWAGMFTLVAADKLAGAAT